MSCCVAYMRIIVNVHLRAYYMWHSVLCAINVLTHVILSVTLQESTKFTNKKLDFRKVKYLA